MRLKNVAKFFDRTRCKDAHSSYTFMGQLEPYDYYKLDGASVKRRMLSTAAGVTIPTRRVIDIDGQKYIVGDSSPDHWENEVIRVRYVLQGADWLATVRTLAQALANSGGFTAYASRDWNKDTTDSRDSAERIHQYRIFFGVNEDVPNVAVIEFNNRVYFVQAVHRALGGFVNVLSNEVQGSAFETINFQTRTYVPITDTYTTTATSVRVLRLRWQEAFKYLSQGSTEFERGDSIVMMLKAGSPTPKPSDVLPLSDGNHRVMSILDEGAYYSLHVRRV